jgi:hypothetical protein
MSIRIKEPVRGLGKRKVICRGDEAKVSRISLGPGKKDLVERIQSINPDPWEQEFVISLGPKMPNGVERHLAWSAARAAYHLQKFFSLRLAKALFPENFVKCREMRFFTRPARSGCWMAAAYSDFVADETGVMARRARNMKQYYRMLYSKDDQESFEHAKSFRNQCDETENSLNPALAPLVRRIRTSGIRIAHPESNYHIENGKTILFEVNGISLMRAYGAACASPNRQDALDALSTMLSIGLLDVMLHQMENMRTHYPFLSSAKRQDGLWVMLNAKHVILNILTDNDKDPRRLIYAMCADEGNAFFHSLYVLFRLSNESLRRIPNKGLWTQCIGTPEEDKEFQFIVRLLRSDMAGL